jgi:hypothetical protein
MGSNIRLCPGIKFQPVKTDPPCTDRDFRQAGSYLGVEDVT